MAEQPPTQPAEPVQPPLITGLEKLVHACKDWRNPEGQLQKLLRWTRRGMIAVNVTYAALLFLLLMLMEWKAESNWFICFCLYVPPQMWLLPALPLALFTLLLHPRWCLLHLTCFVLVFFVYMDPQFDSSRPPKGQSIKLLTNNRGQDGRQSISPFLEAEKPDVMVYQEAGKQQAYAKAYPDMHVRAIDEFTVISRYPIKEITLLPLRGLNGHPVAIRAVLDWEGHNLVIYNIHLNSPREQLEAMTRGGVVAALIGRPGGYGAQLRQEAREFWAHQLEMAKDIAERAKQETDPTIIAGDFNVPNHGIIFHLYSRQFTDAFEATGSGYGLTFPGFTRNPFTGFGPWMRLDQIFSNEQLVPVACKAEPGRRSQHRAMVATFELKAQ